MERRKKTWLWVIVVVVVLLAGAAGVWLVASGPEVSEEIAEPKEKPKEVSEVTHTEREKLPKPGEDGEKEQEDKGEDAAKEEEAANVDVEQVKTVQLPEGTKDVMLDPETLEPKVLIGDTYIRFVDEELNVKKSIVPEDNKRFYLRRSNQGKYLGIYIGKFEPDKRKFLFMDIEGNLIWEGKSTCSRWEGLAPCEVSDDGVTAAYAEQIGYSNDLRFSKANGWTKTLQPEGFLTGGGSFSGNGQYYALSIGEGRPFVILYDNMGNEIWKKEISGENLIDRNLVSYNADYIVAFSLDYAYCLNSEGDILWKRAEYITSNSWDESGIADSISDSSRYLVSRKIGANLISFIELSNGNILWTESVKKHLEFMKDLNDKYLREIIWGTSDISSDDKYIIIGSWNRVDRYTKLDKHPRYVFLLNKSGDVLWSEKFMTNPIAKISKDSSTFTVNTNKSIHYYRFDNTD